MTDDSYILCKSSRVPHVGQDKLTLISLPLESS